MANIKDLFPSRFLKASDLDAPKALTITGISMEEVGEEREELPCLSFKETRQMMTLNRTNARLIADLYGTETDAWKGQTITVHSAKVPFGGRLVDAVRVKV